MNQQRPDGPRLPVSPRLPAEWEAQSAVWLAWPHNRATWPGHFEPLPRFFAAWARIIAESIPVKILAAGEAAIGARRHLDGVDHVELVEIPTNDSWIRDFGPSFVIDIPPEGDIRSGEGRSSGETKGSHPEHGEIESPGRTASPDGHDSSRASDIVPAARGESTRKHIAVSWKFNAWGGKYPPWDLDDAAARRIAQHAGLPCLEGGLCLEGGGLETDGRGRLLTTPTCLVTETRNPGWTSDEIAGRLNQMLGVTEILWLDGGSIEGDDTDGHIDQLARFVDPQNVVAATCEDAGDANHAPLESNFRQLKLWGSSTQPHVQVHRLPLPPARFIDGQRVPESYCNFLMLGRERVLLPIFGHRRTDDHAVGLFSELLPHSEIVPIDCRDLVWGLGALHCASRDQPA